MINNLNNLNETYRAESKLTKHNINVLNVVFYGDAPFVLYEFKYEIGNGAKVRWNRQLFTEWDGRDYDELVEELCKIVEEVRDDLYSHPTDNLSATRAEN